MAQMHRMNPGRLDQILKQKGKTRADIQKIRGEGKANAKLEKTNINTLDKKTVIKMNKGEPVSRKVLEKLAARLEIDIEELVPDLSKISHEEYWDERGPLEFVFDSPFTDTHHHFDKMQSPVSGDWAKEQELRLQLIAKLESSTMLRDAVKSASKVRYKLGVSELSLVQEGALTDFSKVISDLQDLEQKQSLDTDLLLQIEAVKKQSAPLAILEELKELGLHIYVLKYYEYQRDSVDHPDPNKTYNIFKYSRSEILAIGILNHIPESGVIFGVDVGTEILMKNPLIAANLDIVFGNAEEFLFQDYLYKRRQFLLNSN